MVSVLIRVELRAQQLRYPPSIHTESCYDMSSYVLSQLSYEACAHSVYSTFHITYINWKRSFEFYALE